MQADGNKGNMKKRDASLDIAKGIGIILMVVAHNLPGQSFAWQVIFSFHMPLFFVVSGYLYKKRTIKENLVSWGRTLLLPLVILFFVSNFILYLVGICYPDLELYPYRFEALLYNPSLRRNVELGLSGMGFLWFLACMFTTKLLFELVVKAKKIGIQIMIVGMMAIVGFLICKYLPPLPWCLDLALVCVSWMYAGLFLRNHSKWYEKNKVSILIVMCVFWILEFVVGVVNVAHGIFPKPPISLLGALGGSIVILEISKMICKFKFRGSIVEYCGKNSLLILAVHSIEDKLPLREMLGVSQMNSRVLENIAVIAFDFVVIFAILLCNEGRKYIVKSIDLLHE